MKDFLKKKSSQTEDLIIKEGLPKRNKKDILEK